MGEVLRTWAPGPLPDLNLCCHSMVTLGIYIASPRSEPGKILQICVSLIFSSPSGRIGGGGGAGGGRWGARKGGSGGRRYKNSSVGDGDTEAE